MAVPHGLRPERPCPNSAKWRQVAFGLTAPIELLEARGGEVSFHDPHIAEIPPTREWSHLAGRKSVALDAGALAGFDAVLIATDHDMVDYALVVRHAKLVVDTRNVVARLGLDPERVVKA